MKALFGIIIGFSLVIIAGRKMRMRNYAMLTLITILALLTALYMVGYMFVSKKPIP
ncbi:MAG TPA: hypothetical protein VKA34_16830 [Balneolales bacterium]|nr:hypothetical protein [Balneolales bacterium]